MRTLTLEEVRRLSVKPEGGTLAVSPQILAELLQCMIVRPDGHVARIVRVSQGDDGQIEVVLRSTGEMAVRIET